MPSPEIVMTVGTWTTAVLLAVFVWLNEWRLRTLNQKLDELRALVLRQGTEAPLSLLPTPVSREQRDTNACDEFDKP